MNVSTTTIDFIASYEGCRLLAYKNINGKWSIGYGHIGDDVEPGLIITENKARQLLEKDITNIVSIINRAISANIIKFNPTQNQFDALVSFAFSMGTKKITSLCKGQTAEQVADNLLLYTKFKGEVDPRLVALRQKEREMFLGEVKCPYRKAARNRTFQNGSEGEAVKWIQWKLNKKLNISLEINGLYDDATEEAVKLFQKQNGLEIDGISNQDDIDLLAE